MKSFRDGIWSDALRPRGLMPGDPVDEDGVDRLRFVTMEPEVSDGWLRFVLWMENDSDHPVTVGVSGFGLMPNHLRGAKYVGPPLQPPAPPLNVEARIPARSRVAFERGFRLADWEFRKPIDYEWYLDDHRSRTMASGKVKGVTVG